MKMRTLGKSGLQVSEIGLGCEHLQGKSASLIRSVTDAAIDAGINIFELFMSQPQVREDIGNAIIGKRDKILLQGHIGSVWTDGQYSRSRDIELSKIFFKDLLDKYHTDYIDIGLIHFVDEIKDYEDIVNGPMLEYALELKREEKIRALGLSTHNPAVAKLAAESGWTDTIMFSINPAYDLLPENTYIDDYFKGDTYTGKDLLGIDPVRAEAYNACVRNNVGITSMKTLGAGVLLNGDISPFKKALTVNQLSHYALTRPAVSSVLIGCITPEQVAEAVSYENASDEEKDYATVLSNTTAYSMKGQCMYCNHCHPCPAEIDIASVNKYLDLAKTGKPAETVKDHYMRLEHHASECIECGVCEERCPFAVEVRDRMKKAADIFGL